MLCAAEPWLGTELCSQLRGSTEQLGDVRATANLTPLRCRKMEMDFKTEQAPGSKEILKTFSETPEANAALLFIHHSACKSGHLCFTLFLQLCMRERFLKP